MNSSLSGKNVTVKIKRIWNSIEMLVSITLKGKKLLFFIENFMKRVHKASLMRFSIVQSEVFKIFFPIKIKV